MRNDKIDTLLKTQRDVLGVMVRRQELIASNIANADTPHYKARDIDFKAALGERVAVRNASAGEMARTSSRHLSASAAAMPAGAKYRTEFQPGVDGNTVNMDVERAAFADTALRLEAALTFIRGSLKDLQTAMTA